METIQSPIEMREILSAYSRIQPRQLLGFIPTMGALHEGHLSLARKAVEENDISVASIFVNPTQFGPNEDFEDYPRDLERDRELLIDCGVDYIFAPQAEDIYRQPDLTWVQVEKLGEYLCGKNRPGHFKGVSTIVTRLFNIIRPDSAYFGQKDYQQSVIIRKLNQDLHFGIKIRVLPIVREDDGLALSSRNQYLSAEERRQAPALYHSLQLAEEMARHNEKNSAEITAKMRELILSEAPSADIDYIQIVDPDTLEPVEAINGTVVAILAVKIGKTRLIDNQIISP